MDLLNDREQYPRQILLSTAFLTILGVVQFLPYGLVEALPASGFVQGVFSNVIGFVTLVSARFNYSSYVYGFLLLTVALSTIIYQKSSWIMHFLTTATVALYGFVSLLIVMLFPGLISEVQILGLGVQVLFIGLAATETYSKVLDTEKFPLDAYWSSYGAAVWLMMGGAGLIGLLQFIGDYQSIGNVMTAVIAGLGLLGVEMIYSAYELAKNSRHGFYLGSANLVLLMVSSIYTGSTGGALVSVGLLVYLLSNMERYGVDYSVPSLRDYLP